MTAQTSPPPDATDCALRSVRGVMDRASRRRFLSEYWPGLTLLLFVFVALTVIRTIRDDFGVELWRDRGVGQTPSVFTVSETVVAFLVTGLNGLAIWIRNNRTALSASFWLIAASLGLVALSVLLQHSL